MKWNVFQINGPVKNHSNEKAIILTFETKEALHNSCYLTPLNTENYDERAVWIVPQITKNEEFISEYIFVIDCSDSMEGISIIKASECLEYFIRSLPYNSLFNIIKFGTYYEKLFDEWKEYNEETANEALIIVQELSADLHTTNIYDPLKYQFMDNVKYSSLLMVKLLIFFFKIQMKIDALISELDAIVIIALLKKSHINLVDIAILYKKEIQLMKKLLDNWNHLWNH